MRGRPKPAPQRSPFPVWGAKSVRCQITPRQTDCPIQQKHAQKPLSAPGPLGAAGAGAPYQQYPNHGIGSVLAACVASRETSAPAQRSCSKTRVSCVRWAGRRCEGAETENVSPAPSSARATRALGRHSIAFLNVSPASTSVYTRRDSLRCTPPEPGSYIDMSCVGLPAGEPRRCCGAPHVYPAAAATTAADGLIHRSSGSAACRRASALSEARPV